MRTSISVGTAARATTGLAQAFVGVVVGAADTLATWNERRRQRNALMGLSDHLLHDIGVSRLDVEREADKPFWKG